MKPALAPSPVFPHEAPLRVGLLGIGPVGGGTCRVLKRNRQLIGARAGRAIELRALSTRTLSRAHGVVGHEVDLIADPATLGRVRPLLHKEATQRIVAEIGKDLTNSRLDDIERLVARDA